MSNICLKCTLPAVKSAVIGGKYYSRLCQVHFGQLTRGQMPSVGSADYDRGRDYEENMSDAVQPYTKDGTPSKDFIALHPDKARGMWSEDDIRKASL